MRNTFTGPLDLTQVAYHRDPKLQSAITFLSFEISLPNLQKRCTRVLAKHPESLAKMAPPEVTIIECFGNDPKSAAVST